MVDRKTADRKKADRVRLVISQPMLLPWLGMFEQIKLCSHFVFYDDVQLPLGGGRGRGFTTRVQIKTDRGIQWLSVPVQRSGRGKQLIGETLFANRDWKQEHLVKIESAYRTAPYFRSVFEELVRPIYGFETSSLSEFCMQAMQQLWQALGLAPQVHISSSLGVSRELDASHRVLEICEQLAATTYITGWGAMNYIDYSIFERAGVEIRYMDYQLRSYPQLHGSFTPYVSVLDLLFNVGTEAAASFLTSECRYWKEWPHMTDGRPTTGPTVDSSCPGTDLHVIGDVETRK